jgi:hypothetical protein
MNCTEVLIVKIQKSKKGTRYKLKCGRRPPADSLPCQFSVSLVATDEGVTSRSKTSNLEKHKGVTIASSSEGFCESFPPGHFGPKEKERSDFVPEEQSP